MSFNFTEATQYLVESVYKKADGQFGICQPPMMMLGDLGIGKSSVPRVAAKRLEALFGETVGFMDLRLAHCDAGDIKGMPERGNGYTFYEKPDWFPIHVDDRKHLKEVLASIGKTMADTRTPRLGILFLDELNRAPRDVQQAVFQLVLDRHIDGTRLEDGWIIVSAINDNSDLYQTTKVDPALINRFFWMPFKPSDAEYYTFLDEECVAGRAHEAVSRFLKTQPSYIDPSAELIEKATEKNVQVYSRRSWHKLAAALAHLEVARENKLTDWNPNYLRNYASGYVGEEAGLKFARFVETDYKSLSPKDIVKDYTEQLSASVRKARVDEQSNLVDEVLKIVGPMDAKKFNAKTQKNIFNFLVDLPDELAKKFYDGWTKPPYNATTLVLAFNKKTDWGEGFEGFVKYDSDGKALVKYMTPQQRHVDLHKMNFKPAATK